MKKEKLKKLLTKVFLKYKLSKAHAKICSDALVNAELVGATGHGVSRLKMYCDRISKKLINPKPKFKFKKISQSIKQAVKKNLLTLIFTNAPPAIAPHGALKTLFGTNPICFGTPTSSKVPFILDTSVSMINRGKIRVAARTGSKIPEGVALDKYGRPTTDAAKALKGVQLPIAGFRGSGLAWMVDILSGVFTGGNHGGKVKDPFDDFSGPQNIGHLFIVMKSNLFVKNFNSRIKENIRRVKKLPKLKNIKEIMYPGQNKFNRYKKNINKEIKITDDIKKDIEKLLN